MNLYNRLVKQPLATIALLYGAGVVLGHFIEASLLFTFVAAVGLAALALCIPLWRVWLIASAVFLFGWLNMTTRTAIVSPIDLRSRLAERAALVSVRGRVTETPAQRLMSRNGTEKSYTLAVIEVEAVRLAHGDWQAASGRVMSRTSGVLPPQFVEEQRVQISGTALQPEPPIAEGLFDYGRYLNSRGIYHEIKVESPLEWNVFGPPVRTPISERFRTWAQRTLARGLPAPDQSLRLQWAMLLGWETALTAEVSEPFMRSGTMHIFAISGLHIALIAGIFLALFRALAMPRWVTGVLVIGILWFYTGATGWQPSAIRSTVMMTVIILGWMLKRPANLLNSLAAAACIILVWQPEQLFQASFQLSFFVVLSLALLLPPIEKLKKRLFKLDPLLPWELRPWWQQRAVKAGDWIWKGFATSLAAFIGSAPLIAYYFHLFTPGSLLANLLIVPISALALMSGLGALITGDFLPFFTEWFNNSGWAFMRLMVWLSEQVADAPATWCYVRAPGPILFLLYYGVLVAGCLGWFAQRALRWTIIALALVLAGAWIVQWRHARAAHCLTALPLHTAHAVFAQPAHGEPEWLVNCGDPGAVEFRLKPFWQANGGNRIQNLVLTHGEARYVSGAMRLHEMFPIHKVFVSPVASRSPRYREVLSDLEIKSHVQRSATNGFTVAHWRILHPESSDRFPSAPDNAIVALGEFDGVRVLLVPSLGRAAQNAVFSRHPDLRADIIITGAESDSPLADEWLAMIRPKLIVVADSDAPSHRATPKQLSSLRRSHAEIIQTRRAGAVTILIRNGRWQVKTARPLPSFEAELEIIDRNTPAE